MANKQKKNYEKKLMQFMKDTRKRTNKEVLCHFTVDLNAIMLTVLAQEANQARLGFQTQPP